MAPPATFYTIASFPYNQGVTSADFNAGTFSGGAANQVWFKFVGVSPIALGSLCDTGGSFLSKMEFFESDALTARSTMSSGAGGFIEAANADNYWIKVTKQGGGSIATPFTFEADSLPLDPVVHPGDYLINDDTSPFGAVVMAPDGTIRGVSTTIPASEILATLPSGYVLTHDRFGKYGSNFLAMTGPDLSLISAFALSPAISGFPNIGTSRTHFFVCNQANRNVYKIDIAATVTQVATAISASSINAIGVNPAETILYYVVNGESIIRRWNLTTDAAMSDLYTIAESSSSPVFANLARTGLNSHPGEIIVTSAGEIVTYVDYVSGAVQHSKLYHVSAAGSLLHAYDRASTDSPYLVIDHLSRAIADGPTVNVWYFNVDEEHGRFGSLALATGVLSDSLDISLFSSQKNQIIPPDTMFGPSTSCGFGTLLGEDEPQPNDPGANPKENPESGATGTIDSCCDHSDPSAPTPESGPNPVGPLPPWMASCIGGGLVDSVADLANGEVW